jgi:hypothetical protein
MEALAMVSMPAAPPQLPGTLEGLVNLATTTLGVIADQDAVVTDLVALLVRLERHLEGASCDRTVLLFDTR